jgi:hypothetical protein
VKHSYKWGSVQKPKEEIPNIPDWGTCWSNVINSDENLHLCKKERVK